MPSPPDGEDTLADLVAAVRNDPNQRETLVDLLPENAPLYAGRGTSTTARLRGWVLAAFADVDLPSRAVPFVIDELQNGIEPYLVAAAARAARGGDRDPALGRYLLAAFANMRSRDDTVTFEALQPPWPPQHPTTALLEILATVRWLGSLSPVTPQDWEDERHHTAPLSTQVDAALVETIRSIDAPEPQGHCCATNLEASPRPPRDVAARSLDGIEVQDQDGLTTPAGQLLRGGHTVVAFFYTRCPNPNKCSLTITQLAALQHLLVDRGLEHEIRIVAITYDPGFDTPSRLAQYGQARGLRFTASTRMVRSTAGHDPLRAYFDLQVGYGSATVNRHAIELFLLDPSGSIVRTWSRVRWDPTDVLAYSEVLLHRDHEHSFTSGRPAPHP